MAKTQQTPKPESKVKQELPYRVEIYQVWQRMRKDGAKPRDIYTAMDKASHGTIKMGTLQAFASHFKAGRKIPKDLPPVVKPQEKKPGKVKQTKEERNAKQRERRAAARARG